LDALQTKQLKIAGLQDFNLLNKIEILQTKCFDNTGLQKLQPVKQVRRLADQKFFIQKIVVDILKIQSFLFKFFCIFVGFPSSFLSKT
jgi:hypothetical protein